MQSVKPRECGRDWCHEHRLTSVSYGDGKPYWRCPVGHVWPDPPPPDLAAIDAADLYDFEGFTP